MLSILKLHPRSCVRAMGFLNTSLCSFDDKAKAIFANYDPTNSNAEPPFLEPTLKFPNHYGILSYDSRVKKATDANSGDEMQTFAGLQFLPYLTDYVDRDNGLPQAKSGFFANAWYGFPSAFPPPPLESIHPIMFSMHMSGDFLKVGQSNMNYFQKYNAMLGPIGARDLPTLAFLQENGIDTYQSSCFTQMTQMGNFENGQRLNQTTQSKIVVVDVKKNVLPPEVVEQATFYEANMYGKDKDSIESRLKYAYDLLKVYASTETKVLITSRIHAALPASAFGVPVIFVEANHLPGGGGGRTEGISDLFHLYHSDGKNVAWNFDLDHMGPNPGVHRQDRFRASFWNYIKSRSPMYANTARLFGLVPLQRLGKGVPTSGGAELHDIFHFIYTTPPETLTWRVQRAIEAVF